MTSLRKCKGLPCSPFKFPMLTFFPGSILLSGLFINSKKPDLLQVCEHYVDCKFYAVTDALPSSQSLSIV